jgi:hypothetical protein
VHLETVLRYPAPPEAVAALLADRAFVEALCEAGEATSWRVELDGSPAAGFTVTSERTLPTAELPDAVRRFLGEQLVVHQVDTWQAPDPDGVRRGTTVVRVQGAPVTATADLALRPEGSGRTRQDVAGEVRASVPLLGARVEGAAAPVLLAALEDQERLAASRLG